MAKSKPATVESLEAIRQEIQRLKSQRETIAAARCNEQDLKTRVDSIVTGWAAQVDDASMGQWIATPDHGTHADLLSLACPKLPGESKTAAILSYLHPEVVKAKLMESARPWIDRSAVPVADRADRIRDLELQQFAAEVEEEAIVTRLEESGIECYRRGDCDPSIVLACGMED